MKSYLYVVILISGFLAVTCKTQSSKEQEDARIKDSMQHDSLRNSVLKQAEELNDSGSDKDKMMHTKDSLKKQSK